MTHEKVSASEAIPEVLKDSSERMNILTLASLWLKALPNLPNGGLKESIEVSIHSVIMTDKHPLRDQIASLTNENADLKSKIIRLNTETENLRIDAKRLGQLDDQIARLYDENMILEETVRKLRTGALKK